MFASRIDFYTFAITKLQLTKRWLKISSMTPFHLHIDNAHELAGFRHIRELALIKNTSIQLDSLNINTTEHICIYYIVEGKFEWQIQSKFHTLYPGDLAIILPGQTFGSSQGVLDIGTLFYLCVTPLRIDADKRMVFGSWSGLSDSESTIINNVLLLSKTSVIARLKEALPILQNIKGELSQQEIGYATRVNHLIDELLILIVRHSTRQNNLRRDFPQIFTTLEETLRQDLGRQWTVEEMAALMGLGTTAFSEKVKSYTGFSPLNYLINIRISEAIKLLRRQELNITTIALETGFYSSQHFSTTFKKLTGYTPLEFRKKK
jgi:AraC-like DNA-binding protein